MMPTAPRLLLGLVACLGLQAGEASVTYPGANWETATPESQGVEPARLAQAMALVAGICGTDGNRQTIVVRHGRIIWQGDDTANRHAVWSCTKSFLSTCLGLLWDDGRCTPATRAAEILPALAATYPDVTLEHLATFTSGYNHATDRPREPASPQYRPGAAMHYSAQSDLLAAVLTRIAGEPLKDLFLRRIGRPIGLTDAEFHWGELKPQEGLPVNGGSGFPESGVHLTARAMARFGWLYCRRGMWDGRQLISTRSIDHATAVRVPAGMPLYDPAGWYTCLPGRYGLNWWVNGIGAQGRWLWPSAPASSFAAQGNLNNICIIVPAWDLVMVRLGADKVIDIELFDGPLLYLANAMAAGGTAGGR